MQIIRVILAALLAIAAAVAGLFTAAVVAVIAIIAYLALLFRKKPGSSQSFPRSNSPHRPNVSGGDFIDVVANEVDEERPGKDERLN